VPGSRWSLWLGWAISFALLALELSAPSLFPRPTAAWDDAQTAVAGLVAAIFSFTAGVWTFALRESLVLRDLRNGALDPASPAGFARLRERLFALWGLCLLVGLFGAILAWAASRPRAGWPYAAGAAVLLVVHAPRGWLVTGPQASRP
jgi:hypothetical protein